MLAKGMATEATQRAIRLAGGSKVLGEALGITRQAVEDWDVVPSKRVLTVEALSGVSRYELRPDIYGSEPRPTPRRRAEGNAVAA